MISYIIGQINLIEEYYIVVENGGLGYKIFISQLSIEEFNLHDEVLIYTEMIVREDDISLYGFHHKEEKEMFLELTSVNGIGPKNGMRILSSLSIDEIKYAVHHDDIKLLTKAPGVGKKTASRIILELKDRLDHLYDIEEEKPVKKKDEDYDFAVEALVSLGYMKQEVERVLGELDSKMTIEEMVKQAMRTLDERG